MTLPDNCQRCGKSMVQETAHGKEWDNEGIIHISGGYGSFNDTAMSVLEDPDPENLNDDGVLQLPMTHHFGFTKDGTCRQCKAKLIAVLCHDCSHELMVFLKVPGEEVARWHSHTQQYHDNHPEHYGWDYPEKSL